MAKKKTHKQASHIHHKKSIKKLGWLGRYWSRFRAKRWWVRWPGYVIGVYLIIVSVSWFVDKLMPPVKDPDFGVSFSIKYAQELGSDWQANYLALLNDLGFKKVRLMSYWDLGEPNKGQYDFTDLDWQFDQAKAHGAKVSLAIGLRQPRWPECHEPNWATADAIESTQWRQNLYSYITAVVTHYKNNPALESYQLENEPKNNWFGGCREGAAPTDRLVYEFNMVKKLDTKHPTFMSLSDEHGLPLGKPVPDAYGFSIYRVVYSTNTPIHFYITYPITDWYHRLRVWAIGRIQHRPVYVHELQVEPWGSKATKDLTITEQDKSMSDSQIHKSIHYSEKTGIKLQYMWGGEWWYWRKIHFNDAGPWNAVKQELQKAQANSY